MTLTDTIAVMALLLSIGAFLTTVATTWGSAKRGAIRDANKLISQCISIDQLIELALQHHASKQSLKRAF